MPSLSNTFCAIIISSIEKELQKHGYGVLLCDCANDLNAEPSCARFLLDKKVDGLISMPLSDTPQFLKTVEESKVPVVLIDQKPMNIECDTVLVDNLNASYHAVEYLINSGHRKIAIICGSQNRFTSRERLTGYLRVVGDYGLPVREDYIYCCDYTVNCGSLAVKKLLDLQDPPTAIFATNYDLTIGAIATFNDLNMTYIKSRRIFGGIFSLCHFL